jgi:hypothetical protein
MSGIGSVYSNPKDVPTNSKSTQIRRSPLRDRLIRSRESVLDFITGTDPDEILNQIDNPDQLPRNAGVEITGELKRFMDMAKISAMNEQGTFVDYDRLRESPPYLEYRQSCSPRMAYLDPGLFTFTEERIAFWINLYNALIMDGVIAKKVTQSVGSNSLHLLAFFRQTAYNVGGQRMSTDDIEHGVLRGNRGHPMLPGPQFSSSDPRLGWIINPVDVRIHFALNCAGRSCPPIQVYTPENLATQLDLAARNFVNADISVDPETNSVHISAIFNWYKSDFGGRNGVIDFLIEHLPEDDRKAWLVENKQKINFKFRPYDWGLNSSTLMQEDNSN